MGLLDLKIIIAKGKYGWNQRNQRLERLKSRIDNTSREPSDPSSGALSSTCTPSTDLTLGTSWSTSSTNGDIQKSSNALLPLKLYTAATQSDDVDHFIQVLEETLAETGLPVSETVELVTPLGNTLLHVAAKEGHEDMVGLLAFHYPSLLVKQNLVGDTALHVAVKADHCDVTGLLYRFAKDWVHPHDQAGDNRIAQVRGMPENKRLLRIRNNKGNTAMHERLLLTTRSWHFSSFYQSDPEICCFLNNEGKSPLYLAAEFGLAAKYGDNWLDLRSILDERKKLGSKEELLKGKSPLLPAIIANNKGIVDEILSSEPAFINLQDEEGKTPLHYAASVGCIDIVQYLLTKDVENLLKRDNNGFYPIHIAAAKGHVEVVKDLLQHYPTPGKLLTHKSQNILHIAAATGEIKVVAFILETPTLSSLIYEMDSDGNTPLQLAYMNGHSSIVNTVHTCYKKMNSEPVNNACFTALDAPENYIEEPASSDKVEKAIGDSWETKTPEQLNLRVGTSTKPACRLSATTCIEPSNPISGAATNICAQRSLSSSSESCGTPNLSPANREETKRTLLPLNLYRAAIMSDKNLFLENLQRTSADMKLAFSEILELVTPSGNTLLHVAAREGHKDIVEFLSDQYPSLLMKQNVIGDTVLHVFSKASHGDAINTLVHFRKAMAMPENKMLLRVTNNKGNTALHERLMISKRTGYISSLFNSDPEICYLLNNEGKSPLYLAAEAGDPRHVSLILDQQKILGNKEEMLKGKSPLIPVIRARNTDMLDKIISKELAFINLPDEEGKTPLHLAASVGYNEIVQYLLAKDLDCLVKWDNNGFLPIHVAAAQGHVEVVKELLHHCPDVKEMLTRNGKNILHIAAETGKDKVVGFILKTSQCKYLINQADYDGNTPLHLASINWHPKIVSTLTWDKRVNKGAVNNIGFTALDAAEYYMDQPTSFDKRLTWTVLKAANVPHAPKEVVPIELPQSPKSNKSHTDTFKDRVNTLLLVATLVATVSFAAGFTMPGGYRNSDPDEGYATMLHKRAFYVFVFSDTIAMYSSILVAISLIWAQLGDLRLVHIALRLAIPLLGVSLTMMSLAFMAGVYLVVSTLNWLAYSVLIMGSVFLCAHLVIFFPLCFPVTSGNIVLRYISYYPLQLMIYLTGEDKNAA